MGGNHGAIYPIQMNIDKLRQQYTAYLRTDGYIPVPKGERNTPVGGQLNLTVENDQSLSSIKAAIATKKAELKPKPTTNPRKIAKKIKKQEKKKKKTPREKKKKKKKKKK